MVLVNSVYGKQLKRPKRKFDPRSAVELAEAGREPAHPAVRPCSGASKVQTPENGKHQKEASEDAFLFSTT